MAGDKEVRLRIRALDAVTRPLNRVRVSMRRLEKSTKRLSARFAIAAKKTKRFRDAMTKAGRSMRSVGRSMTTRLSAPIALAGGAILRTAANFQKSMNRVGALTKTIVKGEVSPAFHDLQKKAMELGASTEFSASQVADAMGYMGRAGFSAKEVLAGIPDVLALASATGMDLAFSADVVTKTIRQFGKSAEDAGHITDIFAEVTRSTNVDLEMMAETFKNAAPIGDKYGASLENVAALTGILGDAGIQGSMAGTAMKNMFIKLATPSAQAIKYLKGMGVELQNTDGSMKNLNTVIAEMGPSLSKLNKGDQLKVLNELFGLRGITGAATLMGRAMEKSGGPVKLLTKLLSKNEQGISDIDGTAKDMQKTMMLGAPGAIKKFQSALEGAALRIADSGLLKLFEEIATEITKFLSEIANSDRDLLKMGLKLAALAMAAGPVVMALGSMVSVVGSLALVASTLGVGLLPLIGFFGLLGYATYEVLKNLEGIRDFFNDLASNPGNALSQMIIGNIPDFLGGEFFREQDLKKRKQIREKGIPGLEEAREKVRLRDEGMKFPLINAPLGTTPITGGKPLGAKESTQGMNNKSTTNNSKVEVTIKNESDKKVDTKGTTNDMASFILNTGPAGALG